jgi:hypothetical protein
MPESREDGGAQPTRSTAREPLLSPTFPAKAAINVKVLYDFVGDDSKEMAVKVNEIVNILCKQSNGE